MTEKVNKTTGYPLLKDRLLKLYIERKTLNDISKELGISVETAQRWRKRLIRDEGTLTNKRVVALKREYIVRSVHDLALVEEIMLADSINSVTALDRSRAVKSLAAIKKVKLDIFTRFRIVDPEVIQHEGSSIRLEFVGVDDTLPDISVKGLEKR